jgi:signal transduction histidine kinase
MRTVRCRTEDADFPGYTCPSCNPLVCATAQKEFRRQCSLRCKSAMGGSMLDDEGAPIQVLEDERAAAILFVGSATEPGPGAALLAAEPGLPGVPVAEDGILIVDAESGTVLEPRINGDDSVVRDITPYTRPLRQARLRVEELTTANRRKDEFLAMLSHELRSPLAAIQNAVRLLSSQTGESPPRQRTQALIERQVRRMTQLVDDLLDVSQRERRGKRDCGESRHRARTTSRSTGT